MSDFKQTWWDDVLPSKWAEFESWIGSSAATTKAYSRAHIKNKGYKSLIDLGCGNATEYFAYKEEYPELNYIGVDSSKFLFKRNTDLEIPMILAEADSVPLPDNAVEVVFVRHVLEHQPTYVPIMNEMIRLAEKEAIHIFFIKPDEQPTYINFDPAQNLFHNRYNIGEMEEFLRSHKDVESFSWVDLTEYEKGLSIIKKASN